VRGTRPPAAGPTLADLLGVPTPATFGWLGQAEPVTKRSGSEDGKIMLGDITGAAVARRDDAGSSEHGGRQKSKNGDLHDAGRPRSRSAMDVGTRTKRSTWLEDTMLMTDE
jgi:hypothetical protein